jgi:FdhE protein
MYPFASQILDFYGRMASLQRDVYAEGNPPEMVEPRYIRMFLDLVSRIGPSGFAESARALMSQESRWVPLLASYWHPHERGAVLGDSEVLLLRALLQPYAEYCAAQSGVDRNAVRNTCPFCEELPVVGVLRPEGEGARRLLLCGLCSTEWAFRRMLCPNCGEEAEDKLPVYTAVGFEHVRVEACDSCGVYFKSVDLSKDGHAVPLVDELATVPLNVWAEERNYTKLCPNLVGM